MVDIASNNINLDKFSKRFTQLVQDNETDIPTLAENLGIKGLSTIYRYMKGNMSPKISTVKCIADIYNVNPAWLMGYDVPINSHISNMKCELITDEDFFNGYKRLPEEHKQILKNTLEVFLRSQGGK